MKPRLKLIIISVGILVLMCSIYLLYISTSQLKNYTPPSFYTENCKYDVSVILQYDGGYMRDPISYDDIPRENSGYHPKEEIRKKLIYISIVDKSGDIIPIVPNNYRGKIPFTVEFKYENSNKEIWLKCTISEYNETDGIRAVQMESTDAIL
ncbi:MAG: hypothetical protein WAT71_08020 [Ignavibacteria bacterium]